MTIPKLKARYYNLYQIVVVAAFHHFDVIQLGVAQWDNYLFALEH